MKTLVITPLQGEHNHFSSAFARNSFAPDKAVIGRLPVERFPTLGVTLAQGGLGKAQFALQTQHLLDCGSDWDVVICAGAAGGLSDDLSIGDVVVATATVEHDHLNKFGPPRTPTFDADPAHLADLQRISGLPQTFKVHFGTIASGDEDIVEPERRDHLIKKHDALACAWEGAGGARACAFSQVPYLEIRGITDAANHAAPSDFKSNLELAMSNIAVLILTWVQQTQS